MKSWKFIKLVIFKVMGIDECGWMREILFIYLVGERGVVVVVRFGFEVVVVLWGFIK